MNKESVIQHILAKAANSPRPSAEAFAPVNIALCKYWGKRDEELNLPVTSSLSISLGPKGTHTTISARSDHDELIINGEQSPRNDPVYIRARKFLDLFRSSTVPFFELDSVSSVPLAAGLASSASGFAAIVLALDRLMGWDLSMKELSILARLGSGSAARSVAHGFMEWQAGESPDGMDSFAVPVDTPWKDLRVGLLTLSTAAKKISSREGMRLTTSTSILYESWPKQVKEDLSRIKHAIREESFALLGATAEHNALAMHATMIATQPPVCYWLPQSLEQMHRVWALREEGLPVYFTMDAGPNLKLLYEKRNEAAVLNAFPTAESVDPFTK